MAAGSERGRPSGANRYTKLLERIFHGKHDVGKTRIEFARDEIAEAAAALNLPLPKNLGDVIYTFRYRAPLPESILASAPTGRTWIIEPAGIGRYRFALVEDLTLEPNPNLAETKIPDATPGMIAKYAFDNEQGVLARIRYNRLLDVFLGIACYSLQNHFRTTVPGMGQIETDEIYVGVDKRGVHYVIPVQAKGDRDKLNRVQIEQDIAMCADKAPRPHLSSDRHAVDERRPRCAVRVREGRAESARGGREALSTRAPGLRDDERPASLQGTVGGCVTHPALVAAGLSAKGGSGEEGGPAEKRRQSMSQYPAFVDGETGAYGVTFPDLLGIVAMGETMDDALVHAEEALRDYVTETERNGAQIAASRIEDVSPPEGSVLVAIRS